MYNARQFSRMCGVTVRALHHYDRIGLLRPRRTSAGYRVYEDRDVERLEQIVALKSLGAPLAKIREMLDAHPLGLADALRAQRRVLEERRRMLGRAIRAILAAERYVKSGGANRSAALKKVMETIQMEKQTEWTNQYYGDEAREKIEAGKGRWSPELQERVSRQWTDLIAEVQASLGEDPAGPKAQMLASRWMGLVNEFTGGDANIQAGLGRMWADRANWPADVNAKAPAIRPEVWRFIQDAMAAAKR